MIEPLAAQRDFFRRVMKRYDLDFVIMNEMVEEMGEYGPEPLRDATGPEMHMWEMLVPIFIREKIAAAYQGADLTLDALPEEIYPVVLFHGPIVYLNAKDFAVLLRSPPKDDLGLGTSLEPITIRELLLLGHYATVTCNGNSTKIFVSREIPQGYFLELSDPESALNWRPTQSEREVKPPLETWPYLLKLQPLLLD